MVIQAATKYIYTICIVFVSASMIGRADMEQINQIQQRLLINNKTVTMQVAESFQLEVVSLQLQQPRMLSFSANKELFVGSASGHIYRLQPPYEDITLLANLGGYPHSVVVRADHIFVAMSDGVYQADYDAQHSFIDQHQFKLLIALPSGGGHSSRTLGIGPDGRLYLSIGISGNCSDQYISPDYPLHDRRGGIMLLDETHQPPQWQAYATGLRNPIGFTWHPQSSLLYATNNGPDHWGYHQPEEYFSRITYGSFHGMPWFQYEQTELRRDTCIQSHPPRTDVTPPEITLPARSAPMGFDFLRAGKYKDDALIALHGSWATLPDGGFIGDAATRRAPKLVILRFRNGKPVRVEDFVTGFQTDRGQRWARPVDVRVGPDQAIYFTSDSETQGLFRLRVINQSQPKQEY